MTETAILDLKLDGNSRTPLFGEWRSFSAPVGAIAHPSELPETLEFSAQVPGTVASMLNEAGKWSFEHPPEIDASDWWYRTTFSRPQSQAERLHLEFDGLATLAEVWLNGQQILSSSNMFRRHLVEISESVAQENELVICFRSVTAGLKRKRPRPRWKTNLVNNQQLRWMRTTLQGRIPGWSPPAPAIGPWRPIRLISEPTVTDLSVVPTLEGANGIVRLSARLLSHSEISHSEISHSETTTGETITGELRVGEQVSPLEVMRTSEGIFLISELRYENPELWWPHTHGRPALYHSEIRCQIDGEEQTFALSPIGFRSLQFSYENGFSVSVNGELVQCRGACWTVGDILNLTGNPESLRRDLTLARDAGANMLRVGGTMVYESDEFYRLCDELGLLVWQDFMFANMDYPVEDPEFRTEIRAEATEQLRRLAAHPSVAVYCGSSEIEQQAAMLGMPRELWRNDWFGEELPALCAELHPGTGYLPSTPCGGVLPFHTNAGVTHYYGVGAYLRPVSDLRQADVKFTPESLGFSNVPEPATVDAIMQGSRAVTHDPRWKARVPRDTGPGWDFEDVRDHYFREIYGLDPVRCRSFDPQRYLELSRTVPGEMMARAFSEWRSNHSHNQGALVWFYKDLWPAAGWGIIDSSGIPKSTWYYLKRCWQPRQLTITDEGLNGLHLHLTNETSSAINGSLEVTLLKEPNRIVVRQETAVELQTRSKVLRSADEILGGFYDVSYAYRFGPPHHDIVIATWYDSSRQIISQAYHFIGNRNVHSLPVQGVETLARDMGDGSYEVTIRAERFLNAVRLNAKHYLPEDNYFHLPPGEEKRVLFHPLGKSTSFRGEIEALNLELSGIPTEQKAG